MKIWSILILLCLPIPALSHDFTYDNLLNAYIVLNPNYDYESHVDSYMKIYRKEVWNRYRNDEFELEDKRRESLNVWKKSLAEFNLSEEFSIRTSFEFGDYDFEKEQFPLDGITQSTYFYQSRTWHYSFPSRIKVFFRNPEIVKELNMSKELAREFLTSRKDRYGNVDRKVVAKIQFLPAQLKANGEILVELISVTLYSDSGMTRELVTFR